MSRVLHDYQLNEIKIAVVVLKNKNISYQLQDMKIEDIIRNIWKLDVGESEDKLYYALERALYKSYNEFQKVLLRALIHKEAYLEIKELGFDKIKL